MRRTTMLPCLLMLAVFLTAGLAEGGRKERKKARKWLGKPAGELVAVMGSPDEEEALESGRWLIWHRAPITYIDPDTGFDARDLEDVGSPPIPGDPTRLPPGIVQCRVRVGADGIIQRVNLPEGCILPEPAESDDEAPPKKELPHREGTVRQP